MSESGFWTLLAPKFKKQGITYDRIESYTSRGIADVQAYIKGKIVPIELKFEKGMKIGLRPEQVIWHYQRNKEGIKTYILVRRMTATLDQIEVHTFDYTTKEPKLRKINSKKGTGYNLDTLIQFIVDDID